MTATRHVQDEACPGSRLVGHSIGCVRSDTCDAQILQTDYDIFNALVPYWNQGYTAYANKMNKKRDY